MSRPDIDSLVESVAGGLPTGGPQEDFRNLIGLITDQLTSVSPGGNWLQAGGATSKSNAGPQGVSLSVTGANGSYTATIKNAGNSSNNPNVFYEVSYCATKGFTSNVTTLPPSAATSVTLSLPNQTLFFRVRATFDFVNWSSYALAANSAASSGLISSAATSEAGAFNQTNYLNVDSVATGSTASVRIYGTAGPLTSGVSVKGGVQTLRPSATIVNVAPASNQFAAWDGEGYLLRPTLATVLNDKLTPIGKVAVVGTGVPTLPTVVPIVSNGAIVAYNVTNGGNGATADYVFTITDPGESGAGASTGQQTFSAGVLQSVAPGNPGQNYGANTAVSAAGGTSGGAPGGGTALGGNGGRLSAV